MQDATTYAGFVADIKKTYSSSYLSAQHAIGVQVRHYKEWDKTDLMALYESYFGKAVFQQLVRLVNEARQEEEARATGKDVLAFAQRDLNQIAPNGMDWKGYERLMRETIAELKATSTRVTRDLAALFAQNAEEEDAFPPFDQQAALAYMDKTLVSRATMPAMVREKVASLRQVLGRPA